MKTITLNGGFHDSTPINVKVPNDFDPKNELLDYVVSKKVLKKLSHHFCGIKGCTCGGVSRATIRENQK